MHAPARRPLVLTALAAVVVASVATSASARAVADPSSTVFINELHYDNTGTDAGEAVEIAAPAGTDLTGWTIVLYNGSGGAAYDTDALSGVVTDQSGGFGTAVLTYPSNGIQNGAPDGLALVDPMGAVEQFLSYEGTFTAAGGPANGLTSTDIGVAQAGTEPVGASLALTGTGGTYGAFMWAATTANSFGSVNPGQTFSTIDLACPATLTTSEGKAASTDVSATDAVSTIESIAIVSPAVEGISLTDHGNGSGTLDVDASTAPGSYGVDIEFTTADGRTALCAVGVFVLDVMPISEVQGDQPDSPLAGQAVLVNAVVTSLFTTQDVLGGFFVQEEDDDVDDDANTSEGVFVLCSANCPLDLAAGDLVEVSGIVTESFAMTQIGTATSPATVTILSSGKATPSAATVTLPAAGSTRAAATFEAIEGMVATFDGRLEVSEYFQLAQFGQLVLTAEDVPYQFTHDNAPSITGFPAFQSDLNTRRIFLDDDNNDQNDAITNAPDAPDEPYPYPTGGLALDNRFRVGDSIDDLTGVLEWSFGAWRIRPIPDVDYTFASDNPAPAEPDDVGGTLKVATFNVLNFFTTIDTTSSSSTGPCGPSGTLDCRGADSAAELERQRAKIVAALAEMDADVVGLIEIQNDAVASTQALVNALNAAGEGPYEAIETGTIGTDAIKVALIYRTAAVKPVGQFKVLTTAIDPRFIDTLNRPALIQTFEQVGTGERLTVAVNHFKSKGSNCNAVGDPDTLDGQGNCAVTRTNAALALADYLATDPTGSGDPDFLILGDLNSYRRETPITTLIGKGYTDLIEEHVGDDAYSFLFDGQLGYLDHALATPTLASQVTDVTEWAINADEVPLFDYNDTIPDAGEASFERESDALPLYAADPLRSSDHNPLVVGLHLTPNTLTVDGAVIGLRPGGGGALVLSGRVAGEPFTTCPTIALAVEGLEATRTPTSQVRQSSVCAGTTSAGVVTFDPATGAVGAIVTLPRSFTLTDNTVRFTFTIDGDVFTTEVTGRRFGLLWIYG